VSRYFNVIGNVLGQSGVQTVYNLNPASPTSPGGNTAFSIYAIGWAGPVATLASDVAPTNDVFSVTSFYRWGNYDTVNAAVQWNPAEVPSALSDTTGSPSIYAVPVPASQSLPPSFFMSAQPSWWATPWGTPPWPANGPDVTGGNIAGVGGHANSLPAALCYTNAPVDTSYQQSYSVTGATWASGTVKLAVGVGSISEGEITVSGVNPAGYNGTFQITASTSSSVSYSLASNPGAYVSGGMLQYPNIRLFSAANCYGQSTSTTKPQPPTAVSGIVTPN
jgi:hypothetical protein